MSYDCDHDCNHCASGCPEREAAERKQRERIQQVIGVVSGKGGVGKSLVNHLQPLFSQSSANLSSCVIKLQ